MLGWARVRPSSRRPRTPSDLPTSIEAILLVETTHGSLAQPLRKDRAQRQEHCVSMFRPRQVLVLPGRRGAVLCRRLAQPTCIAQPLPRTLPRWTLLALGRLGICGRASSVARYMGHAWMTTRDETAWACCACEPPSLGHIWWTAGQAIVRYSQHNTSSFQVCSDMFRYVQTF